VPVDGRRDVLSDQDPIARQLLSAVGQAVVATDLHGVITFWNRAAERIYGWSEAEALGRSLEALLVPAEHFSDAADVIGTVLAGATWTGEFPVLHRNGRVVRAFVTDSAIRDEVGTVVGIVGVSTDITERSEMETALRRNEGRLRARFEQSDMPQLTLDVNGCVTAANAALCRLLETESAGVVGRPVFELLPQQAGPRDAPPAGAIARMIEEGSGSLRVECTGVTGSGSRLMLQVDLTLLRDADGSAYAFDGHVQDLTELRRVEKALRDSESRMRVIADTAQEGIWAVDLAGRALYVNRMTAELLRRDLSEVYASTPAALLGIEPDVAAKRVRHARAGGPSRFDNPYLAPGGEERVLRVSVADLPSGRGDRIVGVLLMISDVTDIRAAQAELARQALADPLTGLGNRTLLLDRLTHAMNRGSRRPGQVALMFVDLDHLKEVNDGFGHAEGDDLLREVGRRIVSSVRPGDTVARFGGDEFVVLCEEIDESAARDIADRLLAVLSEPAQLRAATHVPSASIGLAIASPVEPEILLQQADGAMYEAKRLGRGQVVVRTL
jgi:diguanylate cyclase (GGDEF)-like protein/PAS domain S-box-containing protein